MHGGFPCYTQELGRSLILGATKGKADRVVERIKGTMLALGIAGLAKAGFIYVMRLGWLPRTRSRHAEAFFRENFEFRDPEAPGGIRYFRGRILIRTTLPEDDMNVILRFCPEPEAIYPSGFFGWIRQLYHGTRFDPCAVVETEVLTEDEAERIAGDPEKVDLVISFRDVDSIVGLVGRDQIDMGDLLLENVVQMRGNVGHLFKFGAIAKNVEREVKQS